GELPRVIVLAALGSPTTTDPQAGALVLNSGPPLEVGTIGGIAWVDISRDVQRVTIRRGRPGELEAAQPGGLEVVLDGRSGDYDPANANGPWYGQLDDGFPVWVRAEWGSVHDLGYAYCDEINLDLGYDPTVTFACVDALEVLGRARAGETGSSFDNDSSGARIARILDAVGWPSTLRALDTGRSQLLPTSFGDYALALIQKVLDTEFGTLFADGAGRVAFYDRYHQITSPRSTVVQANLTDTAGAGELEMESLTVDYSRGLVFTQAAVTREEEGAVTQVADNDESQARHGIRTFPGSPGPLLRSDSEALTLAQWLVDRYNTRKLRITQVVVDATTQDLWDVVLPLTILDRISVTRDYGPNTISGQLHIQGMTVEIVPDESWRWTLQTSSPNLTAPMVLNVGPGLGFGELGF
ncbi:MAG TPA: hypothetical protein VJ966_00655, partial [Actinomycetes bacterium]|nr:hypothetical protein [Actinomycetes bacterium]